MDITNIPLEKRLFFITSSDSDNYFFTEIIYGFEELKKRVIETLEGFQETETISNIIKEISIDVENGREHYLGEYISDMSNMDFQMKIESFSKYDYEKIRNAMLGKVA